MKSIILYLIFSLIFLNSFSQEVKDEAKVLTNWLPAAKWEDAGLLGNGEMGALVFGKPHKETIRLSHSAIYLPTTMPFKPIDLKSRLTEVRELILEGNGKEAALIPVEMSKEEGYPGQIWNDPYIPAMDLNINISPENIDHYKRVLNYETGESIISWKQKGVDITRRQFISRKDSLLIIEITANGKFNSSFELKQRPVNWDQWSFINEHVKKTEISAQANTIYYYSEFTKQWEPNIVAYEGLGKIKETDGQLSIKGNALQIQNATKILFFLKINPIYWAKKTAKKEIATGFKQLPSDYNQLLASHKEIHSELFNRVQFELNSEKEDKNLFGSVMMQQAKERKSNAFIQKQFYASRYNILSATGKSIPNLQGIWGNSWTPPWSSDYTHDGNLPVAISSFLSSNMAELMEPFFDYHEARLPYYRENAERLYGCRGIQVPSHTSSHGYNVHFDKTWCLLYWNGGAAWVSHFYYDYWLYTKDLDFLKNRAYPFMKETALFYEDFLTKGTDGKLVFNPSYSPENNPENNSSQATINATMDVAMAKEVFRNLLKAGRQLGEDKAVLKKWEQILADLPTYELDENGNFREWIWSEYKENHHHRHISHLYPMYDMIDPEIASDPKLIEGIRKTVEERMKVRRNDGGGIMVFGLAQMAWVAENLGDVALTEDIINWLSSQYWSNSLATYHDPNGLFNMDLSGGFQTVIIKALLYSDENSIHLLPAKPLSWKQGSIKGIKARNQIEIKELRWNENSIRLNLSSAKAQSLVISFPPKVKSGTLNDKSLKINKKTNSYELKMKANENYKIILMGK